MSYRYTRDRSTSASAHDDGDGYAACARACGSGDAELSTSAWSDGDVTGGNRCRSRRLIVVDQKGSEAEYKGLAKDDIYWAYAVNGVAAAGDKNREDPELFTRLGYGGDGGENCAEQHQGRALRSAKRGKARARPQASSAAAALAKAEDAAAKIRLRTPPAGATRSGRHPWSWLRRRRRKKRRRRWRRRVLRAQRRRKRAWTRQ